MTVRIRARTTAVAARRAAWLRRVLWRDERGMIGAFLVAAMATLLVIVGLALDPGLAFAAKVNALGQAEQAARAGAQQINLTLYRTTGQLQLDPAAAQSAAQQFLTTEHATGTVTVIGNRVTVVVTTIYRTHLWALLDIDTIPVRATGTAVPNPGP